MYKYIVGFVVGYALGILTLNVIAHTPCNDVYKQPDCGYVQVVNPYTGKLERQYVCK